MYYAFNNFLPPYGVSSLKIMEKIKLLVATLTSKTVWLRKGMGEIIFISKSILLPLLSCSKTIHSPWFHHKFQSPPPWPVPPVFSFVSANIFNKNLIKEYTYKILQILFNFYLLNK